MRNYEYEPDSPEKTAYIKKKELINEMTEYIHQIKVGQDGFCNHLGIGLLTCEGIARAIIEKYKLDVILNKEGEK